MVFALSWRTRDKLETLSVSRRAYDAVVAGAHQVDVTTKAGYLGFEWVDGVKAVAGNQPAPMSAPMSRWPSTGPGVAQKWNDSGAGNPGMQCFQGFAPGEGLKPIYGPCR